MLTLFSLVAEAQTPPRPAPASESASQQPAPANPENLLAEADSALQREEWATAAALLEAHLTSDPNDYRAKFNLALAYSMVGRQGDAIRLYPELAEAHDLLPARVNLGILLLQTGNTAAALEQFEKVIARQPDHWAAQVNRAGALVALGRNAEAAQAYQRALELQPDHPPTLLAYGKLLAASDPAAAERQLRRALELEPSLEEGRLELAGVLVERAAAGADTLAEAVAIYQEYLKAHPERADVSLHLAEIHLSRHQPGEAIGVLEAARAAGASSYELNHTLLQAYVEARQMDKALALIPELLAENDQSEDVYMVQGAIHMERRQYREAAAAFNRVTQIEPRRPEGYTNLASALYLMKDYAGTAAALEKVSQLGQDTPGTYFLRAIVLDHLGEKARAYENYQKFLETDEEKNPDQEFQARQRSRTLARELKLAPLR